MFVIWHGWNMLMDFCVWTVNLECRKVSVTDSLKIL